MRLFGKMWPSTLVCGVVLLLSILLPLPQNGRILGVGSICTFQNFFGLPCPGCGLTRSFVALGHGQFSEGLRWHPLGPLLFFGFVAYFCASLFWSLKKPMVPAPFRWQLRAFGTVGALLLLFWILRLDGVFPMPTK